MENDNKSITDDEWDEDDDLEDDEMETKDS